MKRQIIITIILLIITAFITVSYFKNLNPPEIRTSKIMRTIPGNAPLIFEFNNDKSFYDIFNDNKLLAAVTGRQKLSELDTLRKLLLLNPFVSKYFTGQNIFVSLHPSLKKDIDLLLTMSCTSGFEPSILYQLIRQPNSGLLVTPIREGGKHGFNIYINTLKKRFYLIIKEDNVVSGSFSKELIEQSATYINKNDTPGFVLLSQQQNVNSLANLYINYKQLFNLFNVIFKNSDIDILKNLPLLPGSAALSLNYRSDALMFNGLTNIRPNEATGYLNLFSNQHPVTNHLKDIFPSTTASGINFAVSDPIEFETNLFQLQVKTGSNKAKDLLFNKIKAETGISLKTEFNNLLGNEFAVITTRYFEKYAIISINDGSKLKLLMTAACTMANENMGQLNYDKVPFYLLGDAYNIFKRPYFIIIDNYLILANSPGELNSYYDVYFNRKFLSKNEQYNQFDNLLSDKSNITFFFNFKNSQEILKQDLYPSFYNTFITNKPGWQDFYAASLQLSASDKSLYTSFSMRLNTDTFKVKQ